jgi:hypothetical protein
MWHLSVRIHNKPQLWLSAALAIFFTLVHGVGIELTLSTPIFCPFLSLRGASTPLSLVELTLSTG